MIRTIIESNEVLYPGEDVVLITNTDLKELKRLALLNPRQRVRLCSHRSPNDQLHEMFIVHTHECYVRPHKHIGKVESIAVLSGEVDVVLFYEDGTIRKVVRMGDMSSGKVFYYRLSDPIYHMLLIKTDCLVFYEVTQGPFIREQSVFPEWALTENDPSVKGFIQMVKSWIDDYSN